MASVQKENDAAPAATDPRHGSIKSDEGTGMNMHSNITAAPGSASDTAVATAMRNLEDDICSLLSMARILGDLLDSDLTSFENGRKISSPDRGQSMKVYLSHDQMEYLSFAWNDVIYRAHQLRQRFYAAYKVGAAS